ncbi:hypothetical protein [Amycolatopsis sp. NPDC051128]
MSDLDHRAGQVVVVHQQPRHVRPTRALTPTAGIAAFALLETRFRRL